MTADALAISVVGAGSVGKNLAARFAGLGHRVTFGVRDLGSSKLAAARAAAPSAQAAPLDTAAVGADLLVLAVPYDGLTSALQVLGDLGGTVVVDATNAIRGGLPEGIDAIPDLIRAEQPGVTVVKAFNTVGAEVLLQPVVDRRAVFLPIAGPSPAAEQVRDLASSMGFDAMVIGDLSTARILEDHARLWVHMAMRAGVGRRFGFALLADQQHDGG